MLDAAAETEQPETLVPDWTDFWWTNARTGDRRQELAVLIAYSYTADGACRVWGCAGIRLSQGHRLRRYAR
jgi:hypothetical protein